MTKPLSVVEARTQLPRLVREANDTRPVMIGRYRRPAAAICAPQLAVPPTVMTTLIRYTGDSAGFELSQQPDIDTFLADQGSSTAQYPPLPDDLMPVIEHLWDTDQAGQVLAGLIEATVTGMAMQPNMARYGQQTIARFVTQTIAANMQIPLRELVARVTQSGVASEANAPSDELA